MRHHKHHHAPPATAQHVAAAAPAPTTPNNDPSVALFLVLSIGVVLAVVAKKLRGRTLQKARDEAFKAKIARNMEVQSARAEQVRQEVAQHQFYERERLIDAVGQHRAALVRNLERAVTRNDYGAIREDRRTEVLTEFFDSIRLDRHAIPTAEATELVAEHLSSFHERDGIAGFDPTSLPAGGHEFERWVADALSAFGWHADVTAASGDQGIDVIATRDGRRLGLQCKLYSSPIGNWAVQEAHAGKTFYGVEQVGVLSNAAFTNSARDLAMATGVLLFSHHDIPQLFEKAFAETTGGATLPSRSIETRRTFSSQDDLGKPAAGRRENSLFADYPFYDGGYLFDGQPTGEHDAETQLYRKAVQIVAESQKASTSYLQRQLRVGYNSAARLIERMEKDGLVGRPDQVGRREVLMDPDGHPI